MNILIYIALIPLWRHSNKKKNQEDLKNGIMRALEIANHNNLLTITVSSIGNVVFWFLHRFVYDNNAANMRDFINKNSIHR